MKLNLKKTVIRGGNLTMICLLGAFCALSAAKHPQASAEIYDIPCPDTEDFMDQPCLGVYSVIAGEACATRWVSNPPSGPQEQHCCRYQQSNVYCSDNTLEGHHYDFIHEYKNEGCVTSTDTSGEEHTGCACLDEDIIR